MARSVHARSDVAAAEHIWRVVRAQRRGWRGPRYEISAAHGHPEPADMRPDEGTFDHAVRNSQSAISVPSLRTMVLCAGRHEVSEYTDKRTNMRSDNFHYSACMSERLEGGPSPRKSPVRDACKAVFLASRCRRVGGSSRAGNRGLHLVVGPRPSSLAWQGGFPKQQVQSRQQGRRRRSACHTAVRSSRCIACGSVCPACSASHQ